MLVADNGTLTDGSITPTGGKGASGIDSKTPTTLPFQTPFSANRL